MVTEENDYRILTVSDEQHQRVLLTGVSVILVTEFLAQVPPLLLLQVSCRGLCLTLAVYEKSATEISNRTVMVVIIHLTGFRITREATVQASLRSFSIRLIEVEETTLTVLGATP